MGENVPMDQDVTALPEPVPTGRHLADEAGQHLRAGDVDDQGVILRAALCHEDLGHRFAVAGVCRNAVDRLSRQGDQLAFAQKFRCFGDGVAFSA